MLRRLIFLGLALAMFGALLWYIDTTADHTRKWVSKRFGEIPFDKIILADNGTPFFGSPSVCHYALVSLRGDAPVSPGSPWPDYGSGTWQRGPSPWASDRTTDTSSLWSCRVMNVSQDAFDISGDIAGDPATWWLATGSGGYLYSSKRKLAFLFYFPD